MSDERASAQGEAVAANAKAMAEVGLQVGQVRRTGHALVTILGPGERQSNGHLVLCSLDGEGEHSGDPIEVELAIEKVATWPLETMTYVEWWSDPAANATYYRHVGCDTPHRFWTAPLDDCGDPAEPTYECAHCCHVVPLRPRPFPAPDEAMTDRYERREG